MSCLQRAPVGKSHQSSPDFSLHLTWPPPAATAATLASLLQRALFLKPAKERKSLWVSSDDFCIFLCRDFFFICVYLSLPMYSFPVKWSESCSVMSEWLCNPTDCSLPVSSVHGILQARILEWVAVPFCRGFSQPRDWTQVSHIVGRFFIIWATREAQEYWSG